jgi:hypothetical protein
MSDRGNYTGFAIALAWPQTFCKQPGSWYDPLALRMGLSTNHYYRVGHAAVVLVDKENNKCHYFDFGRYHAPFQHGRVRSAETDHELRMKTIPVISDDNLSILNYREILSELKDNRACHGEGELYASYCPVNFRTAFDEARKMQQASPIPYGPFRINGSNCSRFVNTVVRAGKPHWVFRFRLKYLVWLTPTPMNNVNTLPNRLSQPAPSNTVTFFPAFKHDNITLYSILQPPLRDEKIPEHAQWLSGEGAGSWFVFEACKSLLRVTRYSPEGSIECTGQYENLDDKGVVPDNSFRITYPSNCKEVTLAHKNTLLRFERIAVS